MSETNESEGSVGPEKHERFLKRWSKRKQETAAARDSAAVDELPPAAPPLTDADMPSIDVLDGRSDYSMFLSPEVSEGVRRLALRKLFHSSEFNVRDGLDDYDQDFTQFTKLGDLITADLKHRLERELRTRGKMPAAKPDEDRGEPVESVLTADSEVGAQKVLPPESPAATAPAEPAQRLHDDESQA